jgi:hypothetical protein
MSITSGLLERGDSVRADGRRSSVAVPRADTPAIDDLAKRSREEEFRSALDAYIADYREYQARRAEDRLRRRTRPAASGLGNLPAAVRTIFSFSAGLIGPNRRRSDRPAPANS